MGFFPFASAGSGVGQADPAAYNLLIWTGTYQSSTANGLQPAQRMNGSLAVAAKSGTLNHLGIVLAAAATTAGAGINALAIYSAAGALLGQTGDMTASFTGAAGYVEGTLGSGVAVVAGTAYYLAVVNNFTGTDPTFAGFSIPGTLYPIRSDYMTVSQNAVTAFPASFTPSALGFSPFQYFMTGGI